MYIQTKENLFLNALITKLIGALLLHCFVHSVFLCKVTFKQKIPNSKLVIS